MSDQGSQTMDKENGHTESGICDLSWWFSVSRMENPPGHEYRPDIAGCFKRYATAYLDVTMSLFRSFLKDVYTDDSALPTLNLATHTLELGLKAAYEDLRREGDDKAPARFPRR